MTKEPAAAPRDTGDAARVSFHVDTTSANRLDATVKQSVHELPAGRNS